MSDSERFALAARLYSALKRSTGRVVDVLWLLQNEVYAQEVVRLAHDAGPECAELAARYQLYLGAAAARNSPAAHSATGSFAAAPSHYVRGLR
jgi:hypothetical protein